MLVWLAVVKAWMIEGFFEGNQLPMISSEFLAYDDRCYMLYCTKGGGGGWVYSRPVSPHDVRTQGWGDFRLVW